MSTGLIIFIKNPEKGKVKTRLAKTVGDDKALAIYKSLLKHTRQIALSLPVERLLYYSHFIDHKDKWSNEYFFKLRQSEGELGERMYKAFELALDHHEKVIIIGSDCASLSAEIVQTAIDKLEEFDTVIGPAKDGGYYLLGLKKLDKSIFENINWSTDTVCTTTLQRIQNLGWSNHQLLTLSDIDTEADWNAYGWKI